MWVVKWEYKGDSKLQHLLVSLEVALWEEQGAGRRDKRLEEDSPLPVPAGLMLACLRKARTQWSLAAGTMSGRCRQSFVKSLARCHCQSSAKCRKAICWSRCLLPAEIFKILLI